MKNALNKLRKKLETHVDSTDTTYYAVAKEMNISIQALYDFRKGGGLHAESALKLMNHLNITLEDLK